MADPIIMADILQPLLLVKALLAFLCVVLFAYYRHYWIEAKRHLPVHFFYTKWKTVRHAFILGLACFGFAVGFSIELFGERLGLPRDTAMTVASIFEAGGLFYVLYMFFTLVLEDVPHFQHMSECGRHPHRHAEQAKQQVAGQTAADAGGAAVPSRRAAARKGNAGKRKAKRKK